MLKLAANLDWLFTDLPIAARFAAAQAAGFRGVEAPAGAFARCTAGNIPAGGADERTGG